MTTDLRVRRAPDVFVDNDVVRLPSDFTTIGFQLAAASWLETGERPQDAHQHSLTHATSLLITKVTGYNLWLLGCHSAWQNDSRIVRHRRLWGSLKARGLVTPPGRDAGEALIEGAEGVRFFGAIQLDLSSVAQAIAILDAEPASHLAACASHAEPVVQKLVASGWRRANVGPSIDVLKAVCGIDGVVFSPVGAFDDREAGCLALAKPEIIDALLL